PAPPGVPGVEAGGQPIAASSTAAAPTIPALLGWTGAVSSLGMSGSTQRTELDLQASCPTLAPYQLTIVAPFSDASVASIELSRSSVACRYGTSAKDSGTVGQQPLPLGRMSG